MPTLAFGIFNWNRHERVSNRYGSFFLGAEPYSGGIKVAPSFDITLGKTLEGKRVRVKVLVKEARKIYRYTIVGMLVTDRPLDVPDEFMVDGSAGGLSYTLEALPKYAPSWPPGDAVSVLCDLDGLLGERIDTIRPAAVESRAFVPGGPSAGCAFCHGTGQALDGLTCEDCDGTGSL